MHELFDTTDTRPIRERFPAGTPVGDAILRGDALIRLKLGAKVADKDVKEDTNDD